MSTPQNPPARELSNTEKMTWGTCPICLAKHGEFCHSEIGFALGVKANGEPPKTGEGTHLARLRNTPSKVQLVGML